MEETCTGFAIFSDEVRSCNTLDVVVSAEPFGLKSL